MHPIFFCLWLRWSVTLLQFDWSKFLAFVYPFPVYPCELHCYTRDTVRPFADRLRDRVVDGTKCFSHGNEICVDGICKV